MKKINTGNVELDQHLEKMDAEIYKIKQQLSSLQTHHYKMWDKFVKKQELKEDFGAWLFIAFLIGCGYIFTQGLIKIIGEFL